MQRGTGGNGSVAQDGLRQLSLAVPQIALSIAGGAMSPEMRKIGAGRRVLSITAAAIALFVCMFVLLALWQRHSASVEGQVRATLQIQSSSFANGGAIPRQYTCDGANDSPGLQWRGAPRGTKSFALVMNDPDALIDFTHWLVYNIPPSARGLAEGVSARGAMPQGSAQGTNSFGRTGYGGPCPPAGKLHHYVFRLYALDIRLELPPGAARDRVESAIDRHVLAEGQIIGTYRRTTE
jgi:Raf kinase inhibitor-like YbhB/YbcL family protein